MLRSFLIFLVWAPLTASAVVTWSTSATTGIFRDAQQRVHAPLFYNLGFSGLHEGGWESNLELILSNNFAVNEWKAFPGLINFTIPLGDSWEDAPFRRSRLVVGRQFLLESFDMMLLDGVQMPLYWSSHGSINTYGGTGRTMDFSEDEFEPIAGVSMSQTIGIAHLKLGGEGRAKNLSQKVVHGGAGLDVDFLPLQPRLQSRGEWDAETQNFLQSSSQAVFNPQGEFSLQLSHSWRKPHRIGENENRFLYNLFASSAQETWMGGTSWRPANGPLSGEFAVRELKYNSGYLNEAGMQRTLTVEWRLNNWTRLVPSFDYVSGYGGALWDGGLGFDHQFSERSILKSEIAAAWLDKINGINGWAWHTRGGLQFNATNSLSALAWVEVERNHLFNLDTRLMANVTYIQ